MKQLIKAMFFTFALLCLISCSKDDEVSITPPDISNVTSEALLGQIKLNWDMPENTDNLHYVQVSYYDHRKKKNVVNLSTTNFLLIDDTRQKYGDYDFTLTPFSETKTSGNTLKHTGVSGPAPKKVSVKDIEKLEFTADDIEANSVSKPGAVDAINMFDGDDNTIYHSVWWPSPKLEDAWINFDLREELKAFKINWLPQKNKVEAKLVDVDLLGSTDGSNWFLIVNLTKEKDDLPTDKTTWYRSPVIYAPQSFSHLRIEVNKTNKNDKFWTMSEMEIHKVILEEIDPEAPDAD